MFVSVFINSEDLRAGYFIVKSDSKVLAKRMKLFNGVEVSTFDDYSRYKVPESYLSRTYGIVKPKSRGSMKTIEARKIAAAKGRAGLARKRMELKNEKP